MTLIEKIDAAVAARRLLDHPFYQTWSSGELTRPALERYAEQYYQWVSALPTVLSATHAGCDDLAVRQALLENLIDEERGPDNHPELWLRFCDALGLDRDAVRGVAPFPETTFAIDAYQRIARGASTAASVAALYAYESQQPAVMASKQKGLREHYGVTTGLDYFVVHETMDVHHSGAERALIAHLDNGDQGALLDAVREGLDATYSLLDGVYARFVARA